MVYALVGPDCKEGVQVFAPALLGAVFGGEIDPRSAECRFVQRHWDDNGRRVGCLGECQGCDPRTGFLVIFGYFRR